MTHIDRTQCKTCGDWYWTGDAHTCSHTCPPLYLHPGLTPTDLPADRPGVTVRYSVREALSVDEAFRLHLEAVLNHPAETVVRRPAFVKEYAL